MPDAEPLRRAHEHVQRFNDAVTSRDWAGFARRFTDDAVLSFVNVPLPPSHGRAAIQAAYEAQPPDDTVDVLDAGPDPDDPDVDVVRFAWANGELGTMRLRWEGDLVAGLEVAFG